MCTVLLPPGVNPIAVKYIISYHTISYLQRGPSIIFYFLVSQLHSVEQRIHCTLLGRSYVGLFLHLVVFFCLFIIY